MKHILQVWRDDGVPKDVPLMVTENHLASQSDWADDHDFRGAVAGRQCWLVLRRRRRRFLSLADSAAGLQNSCLGWASWSNFVSNEEYDIKGYTSPYFAAHMINLEWVQHRSGVHQMFPSSTDIKDGEGNVLVTSYAVHRPDGNWSMMLVNRDETQSAHGARAV